MSETENDKQPIAADTLNLTKIGIPASFTAILGTITLAIDNGNLASLPVHLTLAVFGLAAIGIICATAVVVTDYLVRSRVTIAQAQATSASPAGLTSIPPAAVYVLMPDGTLSVGGKLPKVNGKALEVPARN